ncbi:kazrin isoform X2 [Wyeomyia smithii]|uniref:kazrin isoform X2 n=1 Tax=Wyeomyia smithii TaxID=174621 RepID=UPI002467C2A0|nr:kazrin isoform X2 [Wyeomyia smithii]
MQLNGTVSMAAATEPPEPPPRNPDKINASLKQLADAKTRSLDTADKTAPATGVRPFRPILSLDNAKPAPKQFDSSGTPTSAPATSFISIGNNGTSNSSNSTESHIASGGGPSSGTTTVSSSSTSHESGASRTLSNDSGGGELARGGSSGSGGGSPPGGCGDTTGGQISNKLNFGSQQHTSPTQSDRSSSGSKDQSGDNLTGDNLFKNGVTDLESPQTTKIRLENERLTAEITRLKKLLENSPEGAVGGIELLSDRDSFDAHSMDDSSSRVEKLENELRISKELIQSLKLERKKLRSDKNDLLVQVKQLCASLQDKEQELRNFIRNFEQRIRESETSSAKQNSERERERWSLLKHARDEAERSIALAAQLNARDIQLQRTQEQLQEARRQLSGCMSDQESLVSAAPLTPPSGLMSHAQTAAGGYSNISGTPGDRGSCSADSGVRGSSDRESAAGDLNLSDGPCENGPCIQVDSDSVSLVSSHHNMYQYGTPKERSPTLSPLNAGAYSRSVDNSALANSFRSVEQLGSPVENENQTFSRRLQQQQAQSQSSQSSKTGGATGGVSLTGRTGRGGTWGSISRVFARSRNRNKSNPVAEAEAADFQWSPLTEEGYAEKLRLLREASSMPMDRWRASQVLAWLEVALGMPQYSARCAENVKSGKVLLELSDAELESGLGTSHPMHRKKLRLAIEEQRRPELVRYPTIGQLGHTWVASEWLPDIGLPQYSESFMHSLVDARMLDTLSKKELEKYLGVTRKFHQASIVHGIHVLRIMKYDRQALAMRRLQSENVDNDPIVWTNQRFVRWARSIDLGEYADNLKDSGVHGGLVILEPSFSGDTMATALGIPPSKNIIRRHLATEFETLILPARATLGQGIRTGGTVVPIASGIGMMPTPGDRRNTGSLRFSAWKGSQGSLTKAFRISSGYKPRGSNGSGGGSDKNSVYSSTSPTPSFSSSEGGIYASAGGLHFIHHLPPPTTAPPPVPAIYSMAGHSIGGPSPQTTTDQRANHRVSAPPMDHAGSSAASSSSSMAALPKYAQHRRVKSISDIEVASAAAAAAASS